MTSKSGALVALTFFLSGPQMAAADECDPNDPLQMNDAICGPGLFTGEKGGWGYSGEIGRGESSFGRDEAKEAQDATTERAQQQALKQQSEALQRQSEMIDRKLKQLDAEQRELEELKQEVRDSLKDKPQ